MKRVVRWLKHPWFFAWALILLGVLFRVIQYLSARPLWVDEAMLVMNLVSRPISGLFRPLDYEQQAPIGFLLIEKILIIFFGNDELVLRLFPLAASIASLGAMAMLVLDIMPPPFAFLSLLFFSFSAPLIYYASEVKPYALDLTIGVFLSALSARIFITDRTKTSRALVAIFVVGAVGLWFSQAIAFILAAIGTVGMVSSARKRDMRMVCVWVGISAGWLASFLIQESITLQAFLDRYKEVLSEYYVPFPPRSFDDLGWYTDSIAKLFRNPGGIDVWPLGVVTFILGTWYLVRTKPKLLTLLLLPAVLAFVVSTFRYYPFGGRFLLFFVPSLLIIMTYGLLYIWRWSWHGSWMSMRVLSALLIAGLVINISYRGFYRLQHPIRFEVITPLLKYYVAYRQPGDMLYLYYASAYAFSYYAPRFNIQPGEYTTGIERTRDLREYARDLERLRGKPRVWLLFSHVFDWEGVDEEAYFLARLDEMGRRLDARQTDDASLYLYNLSQSQ